jgi:E-phenylitaconyl-CoA hydratase
MTAVGSMPAVRYEVDGHLARIILNRPEKMNAINAEMRQGLIDAFTDVRDNDDVWLAILTGEGKAFCAGRDLVERVDKGDHLPGPTTADIYTLQSQTYKPVLAAINGVCMAQGCGLALSSDILIAAESARFGWPQVKRGISSISGPTLLARLVPHNIAMEYLFTGEPMDAATALRIGIINRVVPDGEARNAIEELAAQILKNAPLAVRAMKEATLKTRHLRADDAYLVGRFLLEQVDASQDSREGLLAFKEKRAPVWQAR